MHGTIGFGDPFNDTTFTLEHAVDTEHGIEMIADPGVLSTSLTSPWHHDALAAKDLFRSSELTGLDLDLENLDGDRSRKIGDWSATPSDVSCGTSRGTSVASSECSDEPYIDIEGEAAEKLSLFAFTNMTNDMTHLLNHTEEIGNNVSDPNLGAFGWSDSELECSVSTFTEEIDLVDLNEDAHSDIISVCSLPTQLKKRGRSKTSSSGKAWGRMSSQEKMATIEDLTMNISNNLGLREQLEVIRILNPSATVLPTDTEFVIDLDSLSDEKLCQVRDYLRHHNPRQSRKNTTERAHSTDSCSYRSSSSSASCSSVSASSTDNTNTQEKKRTKKQRRQQQRQERQRQRREQRQVMKEKRSGLFRQEEVLALSNDDPEDGIDIDILT